MNDEPMVAGPGDVSRPGMSFRGVDGLGDPTRTVSPEEVAREAELELLAEHAGQVAAKLPGFTVQEAAAAVARAPALHIRFIGEGDANTEEYCWARITALTHDNVVTKAFAG